MDASLAHFIYQSSQHDYLITREPPILPAPQALVAATDYVSYSPGIVNRPHAEGASRGLGLRHESAQGLTTVVPISAESACRPRVARPIRVFTKFGNGCHPLFNARHPLNCCGGTAEGPAERREKLITLLESSKSLLVE